MSNESLEYHDSDGVMRELKDCELYKDKAGRFWLWSEQLDHNLSYKAKSKEDCLLAAINSLLFTIQLQDEHIGRLRRIADLAEKFADEINTDEDN